MHLKVLRAQFSLIHGYLPKISYFFLGSIKLKKIVSFINVKMIADSIFINVVPKLIGHPVLKTIRVTQE